MRRLAKVSISTALLALGFVVGTSVDDDPPPAPEAPARVVQVPKYIERTKTVERAHLPQSCLDAVKASQELSNAVDSYEKEVGQLPRILDDAYLAIHNKNLTDINKLKSRQQAAESGSMTALLAIVEGKKVAAVAEAKCLEDLGR